MTRVFILGSGFSAEAGAPLSNQILKRIFTRQCYDPSVVRLYKWLETRLFATRPDWLRSTEFEEVLSRLNLFDYYVQEAKVRAGLEENIELLLQEFIKLLHPGELSPLPAIYSIFARGLKSSDSILTFNYDLVLENALGSVNLGYDYQLPLWPCPPRVHQDTVILVAKLHGSINIAHCPKCNRLYYVPQQETWDGLDYGPFIIPPTLFKSYSLPALRSLWYKAYSQLLQADEIIIIGYSLPAADVLTGQLLFFAAQAGRMQKVTIVNGRAADITPFSDIFANKLVNTCQTFPEWLAATVPGQE